MKQDFKMQNRDTDQKCPMPGTS